MITVERILEEVRTLPLIEQIRLSGLLAQETLAAGTETRVNESLAMKGDETEMEARRRAVRQARGSMAGLLPLTEVFLAEKHAELGLEERKLAEQAGQRAGQGE